MNKFENIWLSKNPVIFRKLIGTTNTGAYKTTLLVRFPNKENPESWLRGNKRRKPRWNKDEQAWQLPNTWFSFLIEKMVKEYNEVKTIVPYKKDQECSHQCQTAKKANCVCQCGQTKHGYFTENQLFHLTETFSEQWGETDYACNTLTKK
jgi:hypothetical protein